MRVYLGPSPGSIKGSRRQEDWTHWIFGSTIGVPWFGELWDCVSFPLCLGVGAFQLRRRPGPGKERIVGQGRPWNGKRLNLWDVTESIQSSGLKELQVDQSSREGREVEQECGWAWINQVNTWVVPFAESISLYWEQIYLAKWWTGTPTWGLKHQSTACYYKMQNHTLGPRHIAMRRPGELTWFGDTGKHPFTNVWSQFRVHQDT